MNMKSAATPPIASGNARDPVTPSTFFPKFDPSLVASFATQLGSNLGKNVEGVARSLALPLAIGGVAALFIFMKMK